MAIQRIPCGGFSYDDSQIEFVDNVIQVKGGGGSGGVKIFDVVFIGGTQYAIQATAKELWEAYQTRKVLLRNTETEDGEKQRTQYSIITDAWLRISDDDSKYYEFSDSVGSLYGAKNDSDNPTEGVKP